MSRTHVTILGVQIPLRGLAFVTSVPPTKIVFNGLTIADIREAHRQLTTTTIFKAVAERKVIPIDSGVRRQFFTYHTEAQ